MPDLKSFKLAPLSKGFAALSAVYAALTMLFFTGTLLGGLGIRVGGILMLCAVFIWAWLRPKAFDVDSEGLLIRWPLRKRRIARADIASCERLNTSDLGWMRRIGIGGFMGAFGYFKSTREPKLDGYFSTSEDLVLLRLKNSHPLLISPENPGEFVKALGL